MMSEFNFDRASDWDLQAIIKGRVTNTNTMNVHGANMPPSYAWFDSLGYEDHQESHENSTFIFNELKPFNHHEVSTQKIVNSSLIKFDMYNKSLTNEGKGKTTNVSCTNDTQETLSRRRKNKHKIMKVVQQARGDRVVSDEWNWRKYGEKAIKGSPYPRSYYRCSYPGGCLARKQVEQTCNDQGLFLITYMEEHNHPYPIRRHSQAGRSARKLNHHASHKALTTTSNESQNMDLVNSTITSKSPVKDDHQVLVLRSNEEDGRFEACLGGEESEDVCARDRVIEDDFFAGLEYIEKLCMEFYD
ncbi:WRKY transcription factor 22 [Bienertia sinuspersici]